MVQSWVPSPQARAREQWSVACHGSAAEERTVNPTRREAKDSVLWRKLNNIAALRFLPCLTKKMLSDLLDFLGLLHDRNLTTHNLTDVKPLPQQLPLFQLYSRAFGNYISATAQEMIQTLNSLSGEWNPTATATQTLKNLF